MVSPGIFRMPYQLSRFAGQGGNQDPLAALIGNALGTFQGGREKDIADALAAKKEQDEADWRQYQVGAGAAEKGLTVTPPPTSYTPTGFTPSAGPMGIQSPELQTASVPAPVVPSVGKYPALYRDVGAKMLKKYQPVAEGAGAFDPTAGTTTPTGFMPPAKPQQPQHIDPLSPLGIQRTVERGQQEVAAGVKITPKQRQSAGDGMAAQSADLDLRQLENTNKPAIAEVARWVATPAIGHLIPGSPGTAFTDILRQTRSAGLSDPANAYLKRMFDFASLAGPARYGRRFGSEIALQQIWNDFGAGQLGIGVGGIGATQKNRQNAVRAIRTAAGEPAWKEAQQVPTGGAPSGGPPNRRGSYRPDNPFANQP
jgi:hypothetical protein